MTIRQLQIDTERVIERVLSNLQELFWLLKILTNDEIDSYNSFLSLTRDCH